MSKKILFILPLCLSIILIGHKVFAGSCTSMVGDWEYNCQDAYYEPSNNTYGYETSNGILHVTHQSGCLFHGYSERLNEPEPLGPLTGVINGGNIRLTGPSIVSEGRFFGPNQLELSHSVLEIPQYRTVNTGLCTAKRM